MSQSGLTRREVIAASSLLLGAPTLVRAAAVTPVRFLVIGDWGRNGHSGQREVAKSMGEVWDQGADFVVSTGDNFYTLGVSSASDSKWKKSFSEIYSVGMRPWHPVLGNHDYGGRVQAQLDYTNDRWQMTKRWRNLKVSPGVELFFFDTVVWQGKESFPFRYLGSKIGEDDRHQQIADMSQLLAASTARVKIAFGHHGIYSIGPHGGTMRMTELDDLLRRHNVTAYVSGHDHCLYHVTHRGMHYVCSGAGSEVLSGYTGGVENGCVIRDYCDADGPAPAFPQWHAFAAKGRGSVPGFDGGFARICLGPLTGGFEFFGRNTQPFYTARFYSA